MPGSDKLDDFFDSISSQYMGSVAISKGGKTIYTHTSGYSDIDEGMHAGLIASRRKGRRGSGRK